MTKKNKIEGLCPGEEGFLDSKDLSPIEFRRLVTRRVRAQHPMEDFKLPESKEDRLLYEKTLEKINEQPDFLPASFLTNGAARARAVCKVVVPTKTGRSLGTGFLITRNLLMTNNHVVEDRATAANALAEFQIKEGQRPIVVAMQPDRFFMTSKALDFTIVACDGLGIEAIIPISLLRNPAIVTRHERVNIIQHPRGRQKEIAIHDNKVSRVKDLVVHYSTDTEPGSSGSPVFNNDWELVALHHAGFTLPEGKAKNEGIRITAIVDQIISNNTEGAERHDELMDELLISIGNTAPTLGFFGNAGLQVSELEVQVNGFQGTPNFADVGCWNIEHFNNRVSDTRVERVARVINRLSLDLIGLTEVQDGAMRRLVGKLREQGSRYDFVYRDTRGSQDIAMLYDTDTTEVVRRTDIANRNISSLRARTSHNRTAFPRFPLFAHCKVRHEDHMVEFIAIVVHLKAFGDLQSQARRRLAAEKLTEIIEDIRNHEDLPVVLCGDFNEKLDNDVLNSITAAPDLFPLTADDATNGSISYVGTRHRSLIDHIIVSRDLRLAEIAGDDAAIVRLDRSTRDFADQISDHVPLVFRMILRSEAGLTPQANPVRHRKQKSTY